MLDPKSQGNTLTAQYQILTHWLLGDAAVISVSEHVLRVKFTSCSPETGLAWMPQNTFDD